MDAAEVACRIGLGAEYSAWLATLEALGPASVALPDEPGPLLEQLRFDADDRLEIVSAIDGLRSAEEWRWLLERASNAVRADVGDTAGMRPMPNLPASLGAQAPCFWIVAFLAAVPNIRGWYAAHGIPNDVAWDTLQDLARHTRLHRQRTGHTGLDTQWWISLAFRGGLFAIGRLQYAPYRLQTGPAGPLFWYEDARPGLKRGDPAIGLHIPDGGPLTPEVCLESFRSAREFFATHFDAEYADAVVTCTSWLMDEQLCDYLAPDSNIVQFQRRFELVPGARDSDASAFHFVFGRTPEDIDTLVPRTTLEEAILRHVRNGGHWRMRTGWLRLADQT